MIAAVAAALWAVSITTKAVEMNRPQAGGYKILGNRVQKKRPRDFSQALFEFTQQTTLPLRSRRSGGSRFLAFDNSGRLRQHYFAHHHPVAHR